MFFEFFQVIFIFIFLIAAVVIINYFVWPVIIEKQNQMDKGDLIAEKILNQTDVSCKQIIQLRLDHVTGKIIIADSIINQLRDTYNIKSCGTHWGWFEP